MIDEEAGIVRVATLARVNSEAKAKDRADEEVSANIRVRMEAKVEEADTEIRAEEEAEKALIRPILGLGLRIHPGQGGDPNNIGFLFNHFFLFYHSQTSRRSLTY